MRWVRMPIAKPLTSAGTAGRSRMFGGWLAAASGPVTASPTEAGGRPAAPRPGPRAAGPRAAAGGGAGPGADSP